MRLILSRLAPALLIFVLACGLIVGAIGIGNGLDDPTPQLRRVVYDNPNLAPFTSFIPVRFALYDQRTNVQALLARRYNGSFSSPARSPDGAYILFVYNEQTDAARRLIRVNAHNGRDFTPLYDGILYDRSPQWGDDATWFAFQMGYEVLMMSIDGTQAALWGLSDAEREAGERLFGGLWTPEGSYRFPTQAPTRDDEFVLYDWQPGAEQPTVLDTWSSTEDEVSTLILSPDGGHVLWRGRHIDSGGAYSVRDVQADETQALVADGRRVGAARWSPQGRYLALSATLGGSTDSELMLYNTQDDSFKTLLSTDANLITDINWHPDADIILMETVRTMREVCQVTLTGEVSGCDLTIIASQ